MHVRTTATAASAGLAATCLLTGLAAAPAAAQDTRTIDGPATGDPDVFMTYVGCEGLLGATSAPRSRLNLGPYTAPMGRRSLGLVPSGPGTASGPYTGFDSLSAIDTTVSVAATGGTSGVSYVVAVTPTSPPGTAWSGRASTSVAPGAWASISAADLTYDWSLVALATQAPLSSAGSATTAEFAAQHGDGPGFAVTGFGCDARPFNLDAIRAGGSTFDFEGLTLTTSVAVDRARVAAGDEVTVTGRVTDGAGRLTGDALVLESRTPGGQWAPVGPAVLADAQGVARVVVPVTETTELRWHRPEGQYADEGWSEPVTVAVESASTEPAPSDSSAKK
jgi:hypothetical protein